jgi:hypothetical protein
LLVHYGRIDRRDDCETLPSTASEDSRYNANAALSGVRQSSQHEAPIFIVREFRVRSPGGPQGVTSFLAGLSLAGGECGERDGCELRPIAANFAALPDCRSTVRGRPWMRPEPHGIRLASRSDSVLARHRRGSAVVWISDSPRN